MLILRIKARNTRNNQRNRHMGRTASTYKDYLKKLDDQRLKLLWLCSSPIVSVTVALLASPAWAEGQFPVPDASSPVALSNAILEPNIQRSPDPAHSDPAHENSLIAGSAATSDTSDTNHESIPNNDSDEAVPDAAIHPVTVQVLPAVLEEAVYSAEALMQPTGSAVESPIESAESVPPSLIAQADAPDLQPSEPQSEPVSEPSPESSPSESSPTTPSNGWQFSVEPYFFAPLDVDADVTVSGRSTSLDLGLDDILEFDRAFNAGLRLRAQNDRWGLMLDGFYLFAEDSGNLGRTFSSGSIFQFVQQTSPGRLDEFVQQFDPQQLQRFIQIGRQIGLNTPVRVSADGTVSVRQITVDAAVSYRAVDTSLNNASEGAFYPRLVVAPILGVRTNFLRQTVEIDTVRINDRSIPDNALPPISRDFRFSKTLVDPLLGAQLELALSEQWAFGLRGDVSGFNIGAKQNFTWNLIVGTQYNISRNVALQLAYRFNSFDFETGEGLRQTELNLRQNGLLLSALFRF
jgi:hypothetical protein